eukprot:scaffold314686_cov32-Tisochrysis_lutea.AAC.1
MPNGRPSVLGRVFYHPLLLTTDIALTYIPSLHLLTPPPPASFLCPRFPGSGLDALPWAGFRVWGPGRPFRCLLFGDKQQATTKH